MFILYAAKLNILKLPPPNCLIIVIRLILQKIAKSRENDVISVADTTFFVSGDVLFRNFN